jgi:hypothetical protein
MSGLMDKLLFNHVNKTLLISTIYELMKQHFRVKTVLSRSPFIAPQRLVIVQLQNIRINLKIAKKYNLL